MAASTAAGIKYKNRQDMAMIYSKQPCKSAGTFTTNLVKAAPVKWDKNQVTSGADAQAVIINAGIANACTGEEGMGYCEQTAKAAAEVLGVAENGVLVASTGVIGMQLPIDKIAAGVKTMAPLLGYLLVFCICSHNGLRCFCTFLQAVTEKGGHSLYACCDLVNRKLHTNNTGRSN